MKLFVILATGLASIIGLGWVGLQVTPRPLPEPAATSRAPRSIAVPDGLPAPVERFYREVYGDEIPVIDTAIISGRGTMRVNGITLPVRWRFTHASGQDYRHHIEATLFGARLLTVDERYVDGTGRLELPFGTAEGAKVDQGANLAVWAEAIWMPAVWLTDPRARWEPVDEHTALLFVPGPQGEEVFVARFSPGTDLLALLESTRFKGEEADERTLWLNEASTWTELDGWLLPTETAVAWQDEGTPWARLTTEHVVYNADVSTRLRQER